jgi:RNA polymerase sigma factor (sigma-70 family)
MTAMDEWELLQAYTKGRSEAAFAELVRLHLDWVYSVALRHVGDPHLAEDVVQSVFVLLARKAGSLRPGTLLGGWLFRTTRQLAANARRSDERRKNREATACSMINEADSSDTDEMLWQQLVPHLDQAVAALSEADRSAVLLKFYERMPLRQIGVKLGVSEEAAKKRVGRGVERMREFLLRRGVKPGAAVLAAVLAEKSVVSASAGGGWRGRQDIVGGGVSPGGLAAVGEGDSARLAVGQVQDGGGIRGGLAGFDICGGGGGWFDGPPCIAASGRRKPLRSRGCCRTGADSWL